LPSSGGGASHSSSTQRPSRMRNTTLRCWTILRATARGAFARGPSTATCAQSEVTRTDFSFYMVNSCLTKTRETFSPGNGFSSFCETTVCRIKGERVSPALAWNGGFSFSEETDRIYQ
jgi:hypothetical protein